VLPTINSVARQSPALSPTNADQLSWDVTFSEFVRNVDTTDFSVSGTTGSVTSVSNPSGNAYRVTVSGGDLASLNATVTLSFAVGQNITDSAGNALIYIIPSGTNDNSFAVDNVAPIISISTIAVDDVINATEDNNDVTINGTTSGAEDGQIVTVGLNSKTYNVAVAANVWSVIVPALDAQALNVAETVTADVSDLAGNAATQATKNIVHDVESPTISINVIAGDDIINATEDNSDVIISGTTTSVEDGQFVIVGLNGKNYNAKVTANVWSVTVPAIDAQALNADEIVTADVSDLAGNAASQAKRDLTHAATAPTITISTIASDDIINATEDNSDVTISGTTSGIEDGRTATVRLNSKTYTGAVTANSWSVAVPKADAQALDANETVTADVSDVAGNAATQATRTITRDSVVPTITISTIAGDDIINATEDNSDIIISGTTSGVEEGQNVIVGLNKKTYMGAVTKNSWSVTVPAVDVQALSTSEKVTADVSNLAGNTAAQAIKNITHDSVVPTITISIIAGDDIINKAEDNSDVTISGTTSSVEDGQEVTVGLNGKTYMGTVAKNVWSVTVPALDAHVLGGSETVTADVNDLSDNTAVQASRKISHNTAQPVVSIGVPSTLFFTSGSVTYNVTYKDATVINLTSEAITLNKTGTANGVIAVTNGTTLNPIVTISDITGAGTLGISILSGTSSNLVGNVDGGAGPSTPFELNTAPIITSIADQILLEDDSLSIPIFASDIETEKLTYSVVSPVPSLGLSIVENEINNEVFIRVKPAANWSGDTEVTFTVGDGILSTSATFALTITSVNDAPEVSFQLSPFTFNEDEEINYALTQLYPFISDPDNADSTLQLTLENKNGNIEINVLSDTSVSMKAKENWFGLDTLTLHVSDGFITTSASFGVIIASVNDLPLFEEMAEKIIITGSEEKMIDIFELVNDVETPDSLLNFEFSTETDSVLYSYDKKSGQLILTASTGYEGETTLKVVATDEDEGSGEVILELEIEQNITGINDLLGIPTEYELSQNYPNPFNPSTKIRYGLPQESEVRVVIYNILGQEVSVLTNQIQNAGYYEVEWNASELTSGMYIYRLSAESNSGDKKYTEVKKMLMVK
jgi:Secretion system C-terminal sorting domain/Bacterial Ig domain